MEVFFRWSNNREAIMWPNESSNGGKEIFIFIYEPNVSPAFMYKFIQPFFPFFLHFYAFANVVVKVVFMFAGIFFFKPAKKNRKL